MGTKKNKGDTAQQKPKSPSTMPTSGDGSSSTSSQTPTTLSPEVAKATEMLQQMTVKLEPLSKAFDAIAEKATQVAVLDGDSEIAQNLNRLREEMKEQDNKHAKGIEEIQGLLTELIEVKLIKHLETEAEKSIEAQIDEILEQQVAEDLKKHIPQDLQNELAKSKQELEGLQRALKNSESLRANALLREDEPDGILHEIYSPNGEISSMFPRDLNALFNMDGETCKQLLIDYGIPDVSDSRETNLNRFIQFCGVPYQLKVPTTELDETVVYRSPVATNYPRPYVPLL
jgi:hypothetical protein